MIVKQGKSLGCWLHPPSPLPVQWRAQQTLEQMTHCQTGQEGQERRDLAAFRMRNRFRLAICRRRRARENDINLCHKKAAHIILNFLLVKLATAAAAAAAGGAGMMNMYGREGLWKEWSRGVSELS